MESGTPNACHAMELGARYSKLLPHVVAFRADIVSTKAMFKPGENERLDVLHEALGGLEQEGLVALAAAMRAANATRLNLVDQRSAVIESHESERETATAWLIIATYQIHGETHMDYQVKGLSPEPFLALYGLSDEALATLQAKRYRANERPGFPDRIEVRDVDPGDDVLLVNYVHQCGSTPYRASHAVFVREGAERAAVFLNEVPEALQVRPLSVRAFDAGHWMVDAELCDGRDLDGLVRRLLANDAVDYLQVHFAKRGCYAARVERG